MAENYAQALFELSGGLKGAELDGVVKKLIETLKRKRHMRLLPAIVHHLERKFARQESENAIELVVAKAADAEKYKNAANEHADAFGGLAGKRVAVRTDDSIIGGYILQSTAVRVDSSYRTHLLNLYSLLIS